MNLFNQIQLYLNLFHKRFSRQSLYRSSGLYWSRCARGISLDHCTESPRQSHWPWRLPERRGLPVLGKWIIEGDSLSLRSKKHQRGRIRRWCLHLLPEGAQIGIRGREVINFQCWWKFFGISTICTENIKIAQIDSQISWDFATNIFEIFRQPFSKS